MVYTSAVQTEYKLGRRLVIVCTFSNSLHLRNKTVVVQLFCFEPSVNIGVC